MKVTLDLEYAVDSEDRKYPNLATDQAISIMLLRNALTASKDAYKGRDAVRVGGRVVTALTRASNAKATSLVMDLEMVELLHVRDALRKWMTDTGIPPMWVGWFEQLLTAVEKAAEAPEKSPEKGA